MVRLALTESVIFLTLFCFGVLLVLFIYLLFFLQGTKIRGLFEYVWGTIEAFLFFGIYLVQCNTYNRDFIAVLLGP